MNLQLLSQIKVRNTMLLLCFLFMQLQLPQVYAGSLPQDDEVLLTEAIQSIGRKYQVLFSYDRGFVKEVRVDYDEDATDNLEDALKSILSQTNLKYQIFDQRYVAVYRDSDEGLASLQKMIEHFQGIVDQRQKIRKRKVNSLTPLDTYSAREIYNKRLVINVSGIVTNATGEPLIGVNVIVKGTDKGTATDFDGRFILNDIDEKAVLLLSYIGYQSKEIEVNGNSEIVIVLEEDSKTLDEVVVVGYGTQKKSDLTGAISVVDMEKISSSSIATGNPMRALDGMLPGVQVSYSGNPNATANVLIRGKGTLNSTSPLFVIDGIPTTRGLNEIAASDIESIQVLKDASSASIYGSRASNGVILITTRKAKFEGTHISISSAVTGNFLFNNPISLLDTYEYGRAQWMAARNDKVDPNFGVYSFQDHVDDNGTWILDDIILPEWLDADKTMKPANTNWQDEISRVGLSQNHNIALTFKSKNTRSLLSFDYFDNQGTTNYNNWKRTTIRYNSSYSFFNDKLIVGEDVSLIKFYLTGGNHLNETRSIQSIVPVRTIDGIGWGGPVQGMSDRINPVLSIDRNKINYSEDFRIFGSFYLKYNILDNLNFESTLGIDKKVGWNRNMSLKYKSGFLTEDQTKLSNNVDLGGGITLNNVLKYNLKSILGNIDFMIGQEFVKNEGWDLYATKDGFALEDPSYLYLSVGEENATNGGSAWDNTLYSLFSKISYSLNNKYLFNAILRRDGSSRFGRNNRFAYFPSVSSGWILSEEDFLKNVSWISFLKLRFGWGMTGNQEIANYAAHGLYDARYGDFDLPVSTSTSYDIYGNDSGPLPSGFRRLGLENDNLRWETTIQNNIGIDFETLKSSFSGAIDFYFKKTKDILIRPPYLHVLGLGASRWINGAEMKNWGVEFSLNHVGETNGLYYSVSLIGSHNRNKITDLPEESVGGYPGNGNDKTILGRPFNSYFGYVADGLFQSQQEVESHAIQPGKDIGRIRYSDLNNDGTINSEDRTWIGVNEPDINLGLNLNLEYSNFDLNVLFRAEIGRDVNTIGTKSFTHFFGFFLGQNYGTYLLDSWSPINSSSTIPAISLSDKNNESRFSSYFVENVSYFKLGSIEVGYNFDRNKLEKVKLQNFRIFLQSQNTLTFNNFFKNSYTGYDPQVPNLDYPLPTSITVGFNIKF